VLTAAESIARIRDRLPATSGNFWLDSDLLSAYNEALDELSEATEFYERYATIPRRKKNTLHDLRGILPEEALRLTAIFDTNTNRWLVPTSVRELDLKLGRAWEDHTTSPLWWFMRGLFFLGVYPAAADDEGRLRAYFSAMHPHATEANQDIFRPSLPSDYDVTLEDYALYTLFADARETAKALEYWSAYQEQEKKLKALVSGRIAADYVPMMGAPRLSAPRRGIR
jgi:hypothetical protein